MGVSSVFLHSGKEKENHNTYYEKAYKNQQRKVALQRRGLRRINGYFFFRGNGQTQKNFKNSG